MEPIKDITQIEIGEVLANSVDEPGNKIKLRSVSHENLVSHLKNIPYNNVRVSETEVSKVDEPEKVAGWSLMPKQYMDHIGSARKPINVKETMIENMRKHSMESENTVEIPVSQPEVAEVVQEIVNVNEPEVVVDETQKEDVVNNIEESVNSNLDVEQSFVEINNIRQQVMEKREQADQAQKEADESDKKVQELGMQYTEVQKQLQEARNRNQEIKQKVLGALNEQAASLANARQQYEALINDANRRKEENQNKIAEMNPKIKDVEAETINVNNDTARVEEYLNAISSNIVDFPYSNETEDVKVRKIA